MRRKEFFAKWYTRVIGVVFILVGFSLALDLYRFGFRPETLHKLFHVVLGVVVVRYGWSNHAWHRPFAIANGAFFSFVALFGWVFPDFGGLDTFNRLDTILHTIVGISGLVIGLWSRSTTVFLLAAFAFGSAIAWYDSLVVPPQPTQSGSPQASPTPVPSPRPSPSKILQVVPFAAQAPFGDWKDTRQQDGCEEASVIMAMRWVKGQGLTKDEMLQELFALSDWGQKTFGTYHDTSADDTVRYFTEYYGHKNVEAHFNITIRDIKDALKDGNLVLLPMNGQWLKNPNYTAPGPEYHFLLVKGYDDNKGVFITNDPGTRQGESYPYEYNQLFNAIRHYGTGYHVPVTEVVKAMLVVSK